MELCLYQTPGSRSNNLKVSWRSENKKRRKGLHTEKMLLNLKHDIYMLY